MILDQLYRDLIGWPLPRPVASDTEIVEDLRAMLADRRRRQAREASLSDPLLERVRQIRDQDGRS